jgi:hypothetical protein
MVFTKASVRPCCLLPFPGMRISDVVFSRLNETSQEMEVRRQNEHILSKEYFFDDSRCFLTKITWRYFSIHGSLVEMSASAGVWQGDHGPPVDTPPCGFQNERCYRTGTYLFVAKITFFWKIVDFVPKNQSIDKLRRSRFWKIILLTAGHLPFRFSFCFRHKT